MRVRGSREPRGKSSRGDVLVLEPTTLAQTIPEALTQTLISKYPESDNWERMGTSQSCKILPAAVVYYTLVRSLEKVAEDRCGRRTRDGKSS